jgi:hypothetical protein
VRFAIFSFLLISCGTQRAQLAPEPDGSTVYVPPPPGGDATTDTTTTTDSSTPTTDATGDTAGVATWKPVAVSATQLAFDSKRVLLYAAVKSGAAMYANQLVAIDPVTATVKTSVAIGDDPASLAITEDSQVLWVGLKGENAVRRVDLSTGVAVPGAKTALVNNDKPAYPSTMIALPGTARRVVMSLSIDTLSPSWQGTYLLDDAGVRGLWTSAFQITSRLSKGPFDILFAYDHETTTFAFGVLDMSVAPVMPTDHRMLLEGHTNDIWWDGSKKVYAWGGEVIDVTDPKKPVKKGAFPYKGTILPLAADRALMVSNDGVAAATLRYLDGAALTQKESVLLPGVNEDLLWSIVPAGTGRLAFIAASSAAVSRVCIVDIPFK